MNIKSKPFLIAAGSALLLSLLFIGINTFIVAQQFAASGDFMTGTPDNMNTIMALTALGCVLPLLFSMLAGGLYALFHGREEPFDRVEDVLAGGAAAAVSAEFVGSIVGSIAGAISMRSMLGGAGMPAEAIAISLGINMVTTLCTALLRGGIGGLIGALFGGMIWRQKE